MSKLLLEALSRIPKRFIDDQTNYIQWGEGSVFIANPKYAPMVYKAKTGRWGFVKFKAMPNTPVKPAPVIMKG